MSHHGAEEDIKHHVKVYIRVFAALMVATVITVAVGYVHLAIPLAVTVALIVASFKGTLVASYFMHLTSEKRIIFYVLSLAAVFFIVLMALPSLTHLGTIGDERTGAFEHVAESVSPAVH
jgi:cytochrome c oxidase subunit 4